MTSLDALESRLGYQFDDRNLLERALTHKSAGALNNERLEFLGDAALGYVVAAKLYAAYPGSSEHALTLMRASLVKKSTLAAVARSLDLGQHLRIGPGERKSGGRSRDSILADALEAVLGAIVRDGGPAAVERVVAELLEPWLGSLDGAARKDPKTELQELAQSKGLSLPHYEIVETTGGAHSRRYRVSCQVEGLGVAGEGGAASRREAEKKAARAVLEQLSQESP